MKKWRCTVCNYIHQGDEPPGKCPVCGADKSKFVEVSEQEALQIQQSKTKNQLEREKAVIEKANLSGGDVPGAESSQDSGRRSRLPGWVAYANEQMVKHHAHPMSVHVPNGVLPVSVLFVVLAIWFSTETVAAAAFYNSVVVLISMPVVLYSGYNVWQRKYGGSLSGRFKAKITAAAIVAVSCLFVVVWYIVNPDILAPGAGGRAGFVLLNLVMLAAAVIAGLIGGKLVFRE